MAIKKLKIGPQEFELQDTTYGASTGLGLSGTAFYLKPASNDTIGGIKEGHDATFMLFDEPYKEKYGVHIVAGDDPCAYVGIPYAQTSSGGIMSAEDKIKLNSLSSNADTVDGYHAGVNNGQVSIFVPWPTQATLKSEGFLTSSYGTSEYGHPDGEFLQAICKWAINHYANKGNITLIGAICPNSWGTTIMHLYSDHGKDSITLLPKYCAALYQRSDGKMVEFGCNNFVWYYRGISAGNADTVDGYHLDDILPYGLENICTGAQYAGGQTTLSNGIITTSGVNADTYFQLGLSEPLEQNQIYTIGVYVTGVPSGNTAVWTWPVGGQSNTNWVLSITKNGWNWATGYCNINGNNLTLMMDDLDRGFYNSIQMSKFVIVKGKQKAYYSPPIPSWAKSSNLSAGVNTLGIGDSNSTPDDYIITQYAGGGTTNTSYYRRKLSNVFGALRKSDITTALGYTPPSTNTTYGTASQSNDGLMTSSHWVKLEGIAEGATKNIISSTNGGQLTSSSPGFGGTFKVVRVSQEASGQITVGERTITLPNSTATTAAAGLMSSADKSKLDNITDGANNYSLPTASSSTLGGIKIGYRESETKFAVKLDMENKAYVNLATASSTGAGLMTAEMVQRLDALESKVDEIIQILNGEYY